MTAPDTAPTADRLRADIDSGQTGEKVAASDPAASPLGTDAEAGGSPPTAVERQIETEARPVRPRPFHPSQGLMLVALILALVVVGAAVLGSGWLALR